MKAVFTTVVSDIKITREEQETLLKADKILNDIFETLFNNGCLNDNMTELFNLLESRDLNYIINNFLEVEQSIKSKGVMKNEKFGRNECR